MKTSLNLDPDVYGPFTLVAQIHGRSVTKHLDLVMQQAIEKEICDGRLEVIPDPEDSNKIIYRVKNRGLKPDSPPLPGKKGRGKKPGATSAAQKV